MSKKHYDEVSVARTLNKKSDIMVNMNTKVINVAINSTSIGNGSWGKIDYLVNYHDYIVHRVRQITGKRAHLYTDGDDTVAFVGKRNKINLANMVRNSIKGKR